MDYLYDVVGGKTGLGELPVVSDTDCIFVVAFVA